MWFEAFDRTLRDLMKNVNECNNVKPFGGKVVWEVNIGKFHLS